MMKAAAGSTVKITRKTIVAGRDRRTGTPAQTRNFLDAMRGILRRVIEDVLLYTGLRRGNAVRIGRQHVSDGTAMLRTERAKARSP